MKTCETCKACENNKHSVPPWNPGPRLPGKPGGAGVAVELPGNLFYVCNICNVIIVPLNIGKDVLFVH